MLNLIVALINIRSLSGARTLLYRERGRARKDKILVSFCPKIAKHLHQPKMFNGSRVFAHSLFIKSKRGSGGEAPSDWRFGGFTSKIIHL